MEFTFNDEMYLVCNIFRTYVFYKFIRLFFAERIFSSRVELCSYTVYFVLNSSIYLLFDSSFLNLINNIVFMFLLTFNYKGSLFLRFVATFLLYVISFLVESIGYFLLKELGVHITQGKLLLVLFVSTILLYFIFLLIQNLKYIKENYEISTLHWILVICLPLGSIYLALMIMEEQFSQYPFQKMISAVILLLLNFFVFYLFDYVKKSNKDRIERKIMQVQHEAYVRQFDLMRESEIQIRMLRHDMKNHIISIQTLVKEERFEELQKYLNTFTELIVGKNNSIQSGNVVIDNIVNEKFLCATSKNIYFKHLFLVPEQLDISTFDLTVILGNLLDNAIEAAEQCTDHKKIYCEVRVHKNLLLIRIVNTYSHTLKIRNGIYLTTKSQKNNHGYGLKSVKKMIEKYNGTLEISQQEHKFTVDVLLYISGNIG